MTLTVLLIADGVMIAAYWLSLKFDKKGRAR